MYRLSIKLKNSSLLLKLKKKFINLKIQIINQNFYFQDILIKTLLIIIQIEYQIIKVLQKIIIQLKKMSFLMP